MTGCVFFFFFCVYQWSQVLGDVGGQVGLWLGFSLITAVELCQLLLDVVRLLVVKLSRKLFASSP